MNLEILRNKTIRFTNLVKEHEIDFDAGMMGQIVSVTSDSDDVIRLLVDFSNYVEYNKGFEQANYYDEKGEPTLKWSETKGYPKNFRETIYLEADTDRFPPPFEIVEKSVLDFIRSWPQHAQVQYALSQQLSELYVAATKLGLYDAADYLIKMQEMHQNIQRL